MKERTAFGWIDVPDVAVSGNSASEVNDGECCRQRDCEGNHDSNVEAVAREPHDGERQCSDRAFRSVASGPRRAERFRQRRDER